MTSRWRCWDERTGKCIPAPDYFQYDYDSENECNKTCNKLRNDYISSRNNRYFMLLLAFIVFLFAIASYRRSKMLFVVLLIISIFLAIRYAIISMFLWKYM